MSDPTAHVPRIFISYSHKDKTVAAFFDEKLRDSGFLTWIDETEIHPSKNIRSSIEDGIKKSDYFLILFSHDSRNSYWVDREVDMAVAQSSKRNVPIIPVQLEKGAVPNFFTGILYLDVVKIGLQNAFIQLLNFLSSEEQSIHGPIPVRKAADAQTRAFNDCVSNLSKASRREIRKAIAKCLDRNELGELWFDLFESKMDDYINNIPLPNCVIEILDRADRKGLFHKLLKILCEDHGRGINSRF